MGPGPGPGGARTSSPMQSQRPFSTLGACSPPDTQRPPPSPPARPPLPPPPPRAGGRGGELGHFSSRVPRSAGPWDLREPRAKKPSFVAPKGHELGGVLWPLSSRGPFKGPRGPFKGPRGPFKGPRGPFKGPRGPFKGPRGPLKGPRGRAVLYSGGLAECSPEAVAAADCGGSAASAGRRPVGRVRKRGGKKGKIFKIFWFFFAGFRGF